MSGFGGRSRGRAALLGALGACLASPALAEDRFELENFRPMPNQGDHFLSNMSARPTPHGQWTLELFGSFADDPGLVGAPPPTSAWAPSSAPRSWAACSAPSASGTASSSASTSRSSRRRTATSPSRAWPTASCPTMISGIGDVRPVPRLTLFSTETATDPSGFSIALAAATFLPTGNAENYQGDGGVRVEPRLALDYALKSGVRLNANVGYMLRPEHTAFRNLQVSDELTWGAALDLPSARPRSTSCLRSGGAALEGDSIDAEEMPIEVVAGLKIPPTESFIITLGGGAGVVQGFGTPDYRASLRPELPPQARQRPRRRRHPG
ncbi:MAG: hypothetical protein R3F43_04460 [bacterium]